MRGRRSRRQTPQHNQDRWLVSYADFITLLFAFFVVMYSAAQVDKRKIGHLAMAIQVAFQRLGVFPASADAVSADNAAPIPLHPIPSAESGRQPAVWQREGPPEGTPAAPEDADLERLKQELRQTLALEISRQEVALRTAPDGLVISLREIGFFDTGSAQIKDDSAPAFSRMASLLQQHKYRIRIEGHTDNVPVHNSQFKSNWELSTARATELIRLLIVKYSYAPERLSAVGYAEYHPIATNDTPEGRAQNRRVDVVILGRNEAGTAPPANPSDASSLRVPH